METNNGIKRRALGKGLEELFYNEPMEYNKIEEKIITETPKEEIVNHKDWIKIAWYAFAITMSVMVAVVYCKYFITKDHQILNNVAFVTLAFAQLFHVFNMSSPNSKIWKNEVTRNHFVWYALILCTALIVMVFVVTYFRVPLGLVVFDVKIWVVVILASLIPLVVVQLLKVIRNRT